MPGSFPGTGNYLVPSGRLHVASYSLPLPIVCFCQHERFSCHFSPTSFQWDIGISATDNSLTTMWSLLISLVWIKRQPYPNTDLATSVLGAFHMTCVRAGLVLRTSGPDFHPAATVENCTTAEDSKGWKVHLLQGSQLGQESWSVGSASVTEVLQRQLAANRGKTAPQCWGSSSAISSHPPRHLLHIHTPSRNQHQQSQLHIQIHVGSWAGF